MDRRDQIVHIPLVIRILVCEDSNDAICQVLVSVPSLTLCDLASTPIILLGLLSRPSLVTLFLIYLFFMEE